MTRTRPPSAPFGGPARFLRVGAWPIVVALLMLSLTIWVWDTLEVARRDRDRARLQERTEFIGRRLEGRLHDDAQILRGGEGLVRLLGMPTRAQWHQYVSTLHLEENLPGIQGVGFSLVVPAETLAEHERSVRAEGFPAYTIRPPGPRPLYSSIIYLEPFDWRNQRAFGYDMYSEPVRREAMQRAADTASVALSDRVILVQETEEDRQYGTLMYLPVYRGGVAPGSAEARRDALIGWVYSPIRMNDLLQGALGEWPTDVSIELFAAPTADPAALAFQGPMQTAARIDAAGPTFLRPVSLFGVHWLLRTRPLVDPRPLGGGLASAITLAAGALLSLALFLVTAALVRRREQALALAEARQANEARFRGYFDLPVVGAALLDRERAWLAVNGRLCRLLCEVPGTLPARPLLDLVHPDDRAEVDRRLDAAYAGVSEAQSFTCRLEAADGHTLWVEMGTARVAEASDPGALLAVHIEDVTARHRQEAMLQARLDLANFALSHDLEAILVHTLDLVEGLTGSRIGFYHFVQDDGASLTLQAWSTRTSQEFCHAEGKGSHYDVAQAGVWADCVRTQQPVIHNDYPNLPNRRGMPPGHAHVARELVVPVLRSGRVVAVLGIGNRETPYGDADVELVHAFADLAWDIAERTMVLDRLRESEARFAMAFDRAPVLMSLARFDDGRYLDVNEKFVSVSGYSREEAIGKNASELGLLSEPQRQALFERIRRDGRVDEMDLEPRTKDGRTLSTRYAAVVLTSGRERQLLSIAHDQTTERTLRRQLEQSQKLESVGRLAGGVAHDFNNMLAVIRGYTELLIESVPPGAPMYEELEEIRRAAERSAEVTRQLLAFARKQVVVPRLLDLNATVEGTLKMLGRLIGEDIKLVFEPQEGLPQVRIDPSQVDQVLANLCVNARDAIDGGGRITLSTTTVEIDAERCGPWENLAPGTFVRLTARDTGSGIPADVIGHVFEPFFTTKEVGQGTGLGLATVYGIARQNGGFVEAESPPGEGAAIHLYFPAVGVVAGQSTYPAVTPAPPRGRQETLLVVEDEPAVLRLCCDLLRRLGYRTLAAASPEEALRLAVIHGAEIRLLVTDVVMPAMNGADLATAIRLRLPQLPCLFMSGYTPETIARHGLEARGVFIQKPFDFQTLAARVRTALETPAGKPAAAE
jgi:PAS domain S-box-containing protein